MSALDRRARRLRARTAKTLSLALAVALVLAACSGGDDAGGKYRFTGATATGKTIAVADRKPAGAATGTLLNGGTFQLARYRGKVVVVNFWGTWCPPCVTETPEFDRLYRQVKAVGIQFVGIDSKEAGKSAPRAFVADNHISYPIVYDETDKSMLELAGLPPGGLPITVVVDKDQRVAAVYIGLVFTADLKPVLLSLAREAG